MVQMSLLSDRSGIRFTDHVARVGARARSRGIADIHVSAAERATTSRFRAWHGRPLERAEQKRCDAYFAAVLRRAVITSTDEASRSIRQRLVAASIEADLIAAGWNRERAAEEARRTIGAVGESAVA